METQKTYPRDVFMNLLNTIALYISTFSVLSLIFDYINIAFPDPLNYFDPSGSIRWSLSLFIIVFGVFLWTAKFIEKDLARNPGKNDLKLRRWLIYLTIFLSALLLIGNLVALIYNFLGGEFTTPFLLKVLSVFAVGGLVFWYYLYDLKKTPGDFNSKAKLVIWSSLGLAALVVIYGFFAVGSPFKQRQIRFDEQRVSDLQNIQGQAVYFWQQKNKLPQSLADLTDSISGFKAPGDPDTKQAYEYKITGILSFELCGNFNLSSGDSRLNAAKPLGVNNNDNWNHDAGRVCFSRNIDPELYQKNLVPAMKPGI
ncbi:MAG: DUF5671 domain-containing protein [Candidatus Wolfebacteria bacterium]|nr:DUF5671 domain-containing protein [Candidatus Wolfebacteria bacterium]